MSGLRHFVTFPKNDLAMSWHPEYDVHPALAYSRSILEGMKARTGRSMEEWVAVVVREGPHGEKVAREWLRSTHGLGATTAAGIASFAFGDGRLQTDPAHYLASAPGLVDKMYSGKKAHLRPLHDAIIRAALALPGTIRISPTKTTVPLYRSHVFANLRPTTQTRIDLGLCLRDTAPPPSERLIDTGGAAKGDRITHRIAVQVAADVDALVEECLLLAFVADAD